MQGGQKSNQIFLGLSTESKPGTCDFSATFYEYDTGKTYIFTGNSNQVSGTQPSPPPGQWIEYFQPLQPPLDPSGPIV